MKRRWLAMRRRHDGSRSVSKSRRQSFTLSSLLVWDSEAPEIPLGHHVSLRNWLPLSCCCLFYFMYFWLRDSGVVCTLSFVVGLSTNAARCVRNLNACVALLPVAGVHAPALAL